MPATHVALMRGINLGGKNALPMKSLVTLFEDAGCNGVRTYIQSGNVLFQAAPTLAKRLPELIPAAILKKHKLKVPVVIRTVKELCQLPGKNPFLKAGADPTTLHVAFLQDKPSRAQTSRVDPARAAPDALAVVGHDVFLHCPNGYGRSKLSTGYFDAAFETVSTVRNWRTVLTLCELSAK